MLGHWINIYNLCYHYCCFVVLFYHKLVKLLKIALIGHYLGKHWTSMGHAKMKLNFFFLALNKLLQTTYHCCSTHRYSEAWSNESKMQNWNVTWCIKLVFSKLALLQRVWQKKNFFTELERRVKQRNSLFKKHSLFKTQVISFFKLKHIKSEGVSVMWNLFLYVFSKMWKGKYPSCLQKYYRLKLFLLLSLSRCKIGRNGQ